MPIAATRKTHPAAAPLFHGQSTAAEKSRFDFVESLLDLVCSVKPMTEQERAAAAKAVRQHYGAETHYVAARGPGETADALAREILARFNGRNARTVARELRIGKTTVYRVIKQAGGRA